VTIRRHAFNGKPYAINLCGRIGGVTDVDEDGPDVMHLVSGGGFREFADAYHETMHALGIPSRYLHDAGGYCATDDGARLLWRLMRGEGYCGEVWLGGVAGDEYADG